MQVVKSNSKDAFVENFKEHKLASNVKPPDSGMHQLYQLSDVARQHVPLLGCIILYHHM